MKVNLKNLGAVKEATIDLNKKLIVFCGPNNMGKTYVSYAIYGIIENFRNRQFQYHSLFSEEDIKELIRKKYRLN